MQNFPDAGPCNIAAALPKLAAEHPQRIAIRCADGSGHHSIELSYAQLDARSDAIAAGLAERGIVRATRTVVMVRPSPEFFLLMFALFKLGAVPVLVDPGIDKRALKQCLDEAQPQAFIGIPLAHIARLVLGWAKSAKTLVTVGAKCGWNGATLVQVEALGVHAGAQLADTQGDDVAAILFTSGSTGVPKGVVYRHRHFVAQVDLLRNAFGIDAGGVDLPTFPPFALFDPALGLTSIIPDMDPTRPANADPRKLHAAMRAFGVTQIFGSPALMRVLVEHGEKLPHSVQRATSAGAPVPPEIVAKLRALLPEHAQFWTPYGATECLPVAVIEGRELESTRAATEAGAGTCVGRPVAPNEVRIIRITDDEIADWREVEVLGIGEVGEITVAGPTATDAYFNRDAATRAAKIRETKDGVERIVHRMGDVGYFDAQGRLWFCGRKTQRVYAEASRGDVYTEQVEPVFNAHREVRRTALVGVGAKGAQQAWLCVELQPGVAAKEWPRIERELRALAKKSPSAARVAGFLRHASFPVDIRHNAKIGREKLALWAVQQLEKRK